MNLIKVKCNFCGKEFLKTRGRINEAKKFGWKYYCSLKCQSLTRNKQKVFKCGNPACSKTFKRAPHEIPPSGICFCSNRCAAVINNSLRRKIKICPVCSKQFSGNKKYCSRKCSASTHKKGKSIREKEILNEIKAFYKIHKRIPIKKERPGLAWRSHLTFGSWNKAIESTGFEPNPVIFSKKFIAKDGHRCDSFAEKIIDDWLYERKIKHQKEVPYPENRLLSADFVIGDNWIEYFGLSGVIPQYDKSMKEKRKLCKKYKLSLIEIYPKDLFPINHLSEIIKVKKI